MADTNKKEYTSNLHPKGDLGTTVYPNVKSENIIDKDTTAYTAGKVPDSSLVSKSLDGISENLETTKIQVEANKNNIETLQGNYTGLQYQVNTNSSDIALTKTQVETNKTNIAKNTQDIDNLSAIMPTDINVDANGYAILEHDGTEITGQTKKVKFAQTDKSASFSEVTIPTASALKTKDGTSFGGSNELNSFFDLHSKEEPNSNVLYGQYDTNKRIVGIGNKCYIFETNYFRTRVGFDDGGTSFGLVVEDKNDRNKYCSIGKSSIWASNGTNDRLTMNHSGFYKNGYLINVRAKAGDMALLSDLDTKQSTLYRHTVKISKPTDDGKTSITFTTSSGNNTPIDSIQDLTTVFGNTDLSVSGATYLISSSQWEFYNKIHVGTSITDTTVDYINKDDVGTYNFIDMLGTTGFTITDNVTAM